VGRDDKKLMFLIHYIVDCFNFSTGFQSLQRCIQISTLLSLDSFI